MKYEKYILKIKNILKFCFVFLLFNLYFLILGSKAPIFANETTQVAESSGVNYQLSYPGLLPDHPLYFLKAGRDRIMSFFISKPLKKAEFNLIQADKRVEASFLLSKKGGDKIDLAQSTFSKAENYFEDAIDNTAAAKAQGMNTIELSQKLHDSNQKHQQILKDMTEKLSEANKEKFATEHGRLKQFEKKVKELNQKQ
ncbi:MAG TPA: DUF5667 domain-containing protein [Xanthomonadales bacterium]|nr:DUF5667 domain-containing protein [Xanthomonadales bacterium]